MATSPDKLESTSAHDLIEELYYKAVVSAPTTRQAINRLQMIQGAVGMWLGDLFNAQRNVREGFGDNVKPIRPRKGQ